MAKLRVGLLANQTQKPREGTAGGEGRRRLYEMVERVHAGVEHIEVVVHVVNGIEQRAAVVRRQRAVAELKMFDPDQTVDAIAAGNLDAMSALRDTVLVEAV